MSDFQKAKLTQIALLCILVPSLITQVTHDSLHHLATSVRGLQHCADFWPRIRPGSIPGLRCQPERYRAQATADYPVRGKTLYAQGLWPAL